MYITDVLVGISFIKKNFFLGEREGGRDKLGVLD